MILASFKFTFQLTLYSLTVKMYKSVWSNQQLFRRSVISNNFPILLFLSFLKIANKHAEKKHTGNFASLPPFWHWKDGFSSERSLWRIKAITLAWQHAVNLSEEQKKALREELVNCKGWQRAGCAEGCRDDENFDANVTLCRTYCDWSPHLHRGQAPLLDCFDIIAQSDSNAEVDSFVLLQYVLRTKLCHLSREPS